MTTEHISNLPGFDEYRQQWLVEIKEGSPSSVDLGHRFARKLVTQWLDIDESSDDLDVVYCDGSGDGGIDIACLSRSEPTEETDIIQGDKWYLVQSKYGSAFQGIRTLRDESLKVIDTLEGRRSKLNKFADDLLGKLMNFKQKDSELNRIVLVFATETPLTDDQKRTLEDIRVIGRTRLGSIFDVEAISIATIYQRFLEGETTGSHTEIQLQATFVSAGKDLLVGAIPLLSLYEFMKSYRSETGDLDQLYEKNGLFGNCREMPQDVVVINQQSSSRAPQCKFRSSSC